MSRGIGRKINKAVPCCDYKIQSKQAHRECLWVDRGGIALNAPSSPHSMAERPPGWSWRAYFCVCRGRSEQARHQHRDLLAIAAIFAAEQCHQVAFLEPDADEDVRR